MTTAEELRQQAGPSFNGQLMLRAATELEQLSARVAELEAALHRLNSYDAPTEVQELRLKVAELEGVEMNLTSLAKAVHAANKKWWQDPKTGLPIKRNRGELIALMHSELSEALEGERRNLMDDKLPQYPMAVVEIVDAMIRELDYLAGFYPDVDIHAVLDCKMAYNITRKDHQHEARLIAGGKQF